MVRVHVLSEEQPPPALVEAAREERSCPSCGGLIELYPFGGSWFADLAHASTCAYSEPRCTDNAEVISLALARSSRRAH